MSGALDIDMSALTGESAPVARSAGSPGAEGPLVEVPEPGMGNGPSASEATRKSPSSMAADIHNAGTMSMSPVSAVTSPPPDRMASTPPAASSMKPTGPRLDTRMSGRPSMPTL